MAKHPVNILIRARDEATKKLGGIQRATQGLNRTLKAAAASVVAYFGIREISRFAKESIALFGVQEKAVRSLRDALANLGIESDAVLKDYQAFASQLQRVTTIGDEVTLQTLAMGASMGQLSGETLKSATVAAIGLSKAYGVDLTAAMRLVSRAAVGDTASLKRYGITLEEGLSTQEKFNEILAIGTKNFNLASGESQTHTGQMEQLSNAWGDAKEKLGEYLVTSQRWQNSIEGARFLIDDFGNVMKFVWENAKLGMLGWWEDLKHIFLVNIPELWTWFRENWKALFTDIWNGTKSVITNMWVNLRDFFTAVVGWLKGESFDFKWTGLLDGFESTLDELPKMTDRSLTQTEKVMQERIAGLAEKLAEKWTGSDTFDENALLSRAQQEGLAAAGGGTAAGGAGGGSSASLQAQESRFLTLRAGSTVEIQRQIAKETRESRKNLNKLVRLAEQEGNRNRREGNRGGGNHYRPTEFA